MRATVALCLLAGVLLAGCANRYKSEHYAIAYKEGVPFESFMADNESCEAYAYETVGEDYTSSKLPPVSGAGAAGSFVGGFAQGMADAQAWYRWADAWYSVRGGCLIERGYVYRRITREEKMAFDQLEGDAKDQALWMMVTGEAPTTPYPEGDETDVNPKYQAAFEETKAVN